MLAQDSLKNTPELALPLTNKKMIIAHCMTNIIRFKGHEMEDSCNPKYYSPQGNITAPIGGLTQVKVMADGLLSQASLDQAVEFEMRAAIRSGIDGFQFYYILGTKSWDDIIKAYFRVAEKKNIDFKFTFCISHPYGSFEKEKIEEFATRMNGIFDEVGRDNKHWLRTSDGRLILYQWYGAPLADIPKDLNGLPEAFYVARAYDRLAKAVHEKFACIFTINEQISEKKLNEYLDYFPATWIWTLAYQDGNYIGEKVAEICKERNRTFTGSVFSDFYTSKVLKRGTWDMYHRAEDAVTAGKDSIERKYVVTGLSYTFRKLFEFAIKKEARIINVITWNDYPEGHHLAPEINHNDGFSILLNYYKSVWKKESSPYSKEVAIVFFKKYKHSTIPNPFNIKIVNFEEGSVPQSWEDSIEVVSILKSKAELLINKHRFDAPAGFHITKIPSEPGQVKIAVSIAGKTAISFESSEGITEKPYRTDQLTYTLSSEFNRFYQDLYPGFQPIYSREYSNKYKKAIHTKPTLKTKNTK